MTTPNDAYRIVADDPLEFKRNKDYYESILAEDVKYAYHYASDRLCGRFEKGEPAISTSGHYSYLYAMDVLKGRFELGEKAIINNRYSYLYATSVLEGRFEKGEYAIDRLLIITYIKYIKQIKDKTPIHYKFI